MVAISPAMTMAEQMYLTSSVPTTTLTSLM